MAKLVLIGGSGFFGKSFADYFNRHTLKRWGIDEIVLYARDIKKLQTTKNFFANKKIHIISGNIQTDENLPDAEYYIYAANSSNIDDYIDNPFVEFNNASKGVRNFSNQLIQKNKSSKSLFTSSGAVYGSTKNNSTYPKEFDIFLQNFSDDDPKKIYAQGKIDSENIFQNFSSNINRASIARCFSFIGNFLPLDKHFAIGNFLLNIMRNEPIKFNSNIKVYRSYMHADDLVNWIMEILVNSDSSCPIYNVGSHEEFSLDEIAFNLGNHYGLDLDGKISNYDTFDRYVPNIDLGLEAGLNLTYNLKESFDMVLRAKNNYV